MPVPVVTQADVGAIPGQCKHCDSPLFGEHVYDCASLEPPLTQYRTALVWIPDVMGPYQAQVLVGERWNGFLIPRFDFEAAIQIVRDQNELPLNHPGMDPIHMYWDQGACLRVCCSFEDDELHWGPWYSIGAYEWCWEEHHG